MEDLSPREGGSTESIEIREKALAILAERKKVQSETEEMNGKKKKGPKVKSKEKKEKEWEELRPICIDLVNEVDSGNFELAFILYPTGIEQLMEVADAGEVMPPKSTWFEPKFDVGLLIHQIN